MVPPTIDDIDVIACGLASSEDRKWDHNLSSSDDDDWEEMNKKHIAKLNSITNDKIRTAYFQQIVIDIDVAEQMKRGDWAVWMLQRHPELLDEDFMTSESRENANYHTLNTLISNYEKGEALVKKCQELSRITRELIEPAADAPKKEWMAYAKDLRTEYEKVIKMELVGK